MFSRSLLSDVTIAKYMKKGFLVLGDVKSEQMQPNSVDLTLSSSVLKITPNDYIKIIGKDDTRDLFDLVNTKKFIKYNKDNFVVGTTSSFDSEYILNPNEFCLMSSNETLNIPNGIVGFVQGRSSIARLGIQTEQAGLIDAGFHGNITFEVYNQSPYPIKLFKNMRIAQVYFFKAQKASKLYDRNNNKYNGQEGATGSMIYKDFT